MFSSRERVQSYSRRFFPLLYCVARKGTLVAEVILCVIKGHVIE